MAIWKHIYVGCPAGRFTGGPTLAHQLCFKLRSIGFDARMIYYYGRKGQDPVHEQYRHFKIPSAINIVDAQDSIVIAPETNVNLLLKFKKAQKAIWWMSVDNYVNKFLHSRRNVILHLGGITSQRINDMNLIHFVQSEYAYQYLIVNNIPRERIYRLSDYLDKVFIEKSIESKSNKEDIILYNPKKGIEFTKKIIDNAPNLCWKALEGLSPFEMRAWFERSKVYIDFGNHPGKDRMPREAAINGCCIITGRRGAAENEIDIPIPMKYKIRESEKAIPMIVERIKEVLSCYETVLKDFEQYRRIIAIEEDEFDRCISDFFKTVPNR